MNLQFPRRHKRRSAMIVLAIAAAVALILSAEAGAATAAPIPRVSGHASLGVAATSPAAGAIAGHVSLGPSATPASDGEIRVQYFCNDCSSVLTATANTDADGNYSFAGITLPGNYLMIFTDVANTQYEAGELWVTVADASQTYGGNNVTLAATATISGVVSLGTAGNLAGNGEVRVTAVPYFDLFHPDQYPAAVTTDATGHYTVTGMPAGQYKLEFEYVGVNGYAGAWWTATQDATHPIAVTEAEGTWFSVSGLPLTGYNLTLLPGTVISGTVTGSNGQPLTNGAQIEVERLDSSGDVIDPIDSDFGLDGTPKRINADGTYSVGPLVSGTYRLRFFTPFSNTATNYVDAHAGATLANPGEDDTITASGGTVTGVNAVQFVRTYAEISVFCPKCRQSVSDVYDIQLERNDSTGWAEVPARIVGLPIYEWGWLYPGTYRVAYTSLTVPFATTYGTPFVLTENQVYAATNTIEPPPVLPSIQGGTGDFNSDGYPDVIARDATGTLWLYPTNSSTGLLPRVQLATGWAGMTSIVSVGDFDGDGHPDIVARDAAGTVWLYPGNGTNGFTPRVQLATGWASMTAIEGVGDFDDDGFRDLVVRDRYGTLWLYPGNAAGGLGARRFMSTALSAMTSIIGIGDFDGDSEADLLARDSSGDLWLFPGDGTGEVGDPIQLGDGWQGLAIAGAGDYDGDGTQDIVAMDATGALVLFPAGDGSNAPDPVLLASNWHGFSIAGDGATTGRPPPSFVTIPAPVTLSGIGTTSTASAPGWHPSTASTIVSASDLTRLHLTSQRDPKISTS